MMSQDARVKKLTLTISIEGDTASLLSVECPSEIKSSSISSGALADHSSLSENSDIHSSQSFSLPSLPTAVSQDHLYCSSSSSSGTSNTIHTDKSKHCILSEILADKHISLPCLCGGHLLQLSLGQGFTPQASRIGRRRTTAFNSTPKIRGVQRPPLEPVCSDIDLTDPLVIENAINAASSGQGGAIPLARHSLLKQPIKLQKSPLLPECETIDLTDPSLSDNTVPPNDETDAVPSRSPESPPQLPPSSPHPKEPTDEDFEEILGSFASHCIFPRGWDLKSVATVIHPTMPEGYKPSKFNPITAAVSVLLAMINQKAVSPDPSQVLSRTVFIDESISNDSAAIPEEIIKELELLDPFEIRILCRAVRYAMRASTCKPPPFKFEPRPQQRTSSPMNRNKAKKGSPSIVQPRGKLKQEEENDCLVMPKPMAHSDLNEQGTPKRKVRFDPVSSIQTQERSKRTSPSSPREEPQILKKKKADEKLKDSAEVDSPAGDKKASSVSPKKPVATLIFARHSDRWYYPGIMNSTVYDWDRTSDPIMVQFSDGAAPPKPQIATNILPLERLCPGATIQWMNSDDEATDVTFNSYILKSPGSDGLLSADVNVTIDGTEQKTIPFKRTSLSPLNVVELRKILKNDFFPLLGRQNFTNVTSSAILGSRARRSATADGKERKKKISAPPQVQEKKRKPDSSSSDTLTDKESKISEKKIKVDTTLIETVISKESKKNVKRLVCLSPLCKEIFSTQKEFEDHILHTIKLKKGTHRSAMFLWLPESFSFKASSTALPSMSTSGPTSRMKRSMTDSDTDSSSQLASSAIPNIGYGLSHEMVMLDTSVKTHRLTKSAGKRTPKLSDVFAGFHFVLTRGAYHFPGRSHRRGEPPDSESDSTDAENYYLTPVPFKESELQQAIECGGGKFYPSLSLIPKAVNVTNCIVVSDHPTTTSSYVYAVAYGYRIIRHDSILECYKKDVKLRDALFRGNQSLAITLLSPGWDKIKERWVEPRVSRLKPLAGLRVVCLFQCSCNENFRQFWISLLRYVGATPANIPERNLDLLCLESSTNQYIIMTDGPASQKTETLSKFSSSPCVTTEWLIQAVITGEQPPLRPFHPGLSISDESN